MTMDELSSILSDLSERVVGAAAQCGDLTSLVRIDYGSRNRYVTCKEVADFLESRDAVRAETEDIPRALAAKALGIPPEQVTEEQRDGAKSAYFARLYGLGEAEAPKAVLRAAGTSPEAPQQEAHGALPDAREGSDAVKYVDAGAQISPDGRYRYLLWREWRGTHHPANWRWMGAKDGAGEPLGEPESCLFVMLNPSTADAEKDDATIRRCVAFAASWQYERLEVVNLFAYRTPSPAVLMALTDRDDPVGPKNLEAFTHATARAKLIVCAWGNHGSYLDQAETALGWTNRQVHVLGLTKAGHPKHPLYVSGDAQPILWEPVVRTVAKWQVWP